jgi:hypothetical protein
MVAVKKDVTDDVDWWGVDGDIMALWRCVCGQEHQSWHYYIYRGRHNRIRGAQEVRPCEGCGRKLVWDVAVYELVEENNAVDSEGNGCSSPGG